VTREELRNKLNALGYCNGQVPSLEHMTAVRKIAWAHGRKPAQKLRWKPTTVVITTGPDWLVTELEDKRIFIHHVDWYRKILNFSYNIEDLL